MRLSQEEISKRLVNIPDNDKPVFYQYIEYLEEYKGWIPKTIWDEWYYGKYLKTEHWQRIRAELAILKKGRCHFCDKTSRKIYVGHHPHYRLLFIERPGIDVVYCCNDCHATHHHKFLLRDIENSGYFGSYLGAEVRKNADLAFKDPTTTRKMIELFVKGLKSTNKEHRDLAGGTMFWLFLSNIAYQKFDSIIIKTDEIDALIKELDKTHEMAECLVLEKLNHSKPRHIL